VVVIAAALLVVVVVTAYILYGPGEEKRDHPQDRAPRLFMNATEEDDHILLTWNRILWDSEFGFTHYKIFRALDGQESVLIASPDINETAYADHSLERYRTYFYDMEAVPNERYQGGWDDVSVYSGGTFVSLGKKASDPPSDLTSYAMDGKACLTWIQPAIDGGHWVESYDVYRGTSPDALTYVDNTSSYADDLMFYFDDNLANGIIYFYAVTANNTIAESNRTDVEAVLPLPAPHISVSKLNESEMPVFSLKIAWDFNDSGSRNATGFEIYLDSNYFPPRGNRIATLDASTSGSVVLNVTSPYYSGTVTMVVEYDDGNRSSSDPVTVELWNVPMDGCSYCDYSVLFLLVIVSIFLVVAAGVVHAQHRKKT